MDLRERIVKVLQDYVWEENPEFHANVIMRLIGNCEACKHGDITPNSYPLKDAKKTFCWKHEETKNKTDFCSDFKREGEC